MNKYCFLDDYSEGCHPRILAALGRTNLEQQTAYGNDDYSNQARALIREQLGKEGTPVYFLAGGTLTNLVIIASALRPHEAVIAAHSGHIALHETGAIEATGHKIITVPSADGKLTAAGIEAALASNALYPHMAKPRLVYVSNTTEAGTVYKKAELQVLSKTCRANNLLLMLDGARLGAALTAETNDLSLKEIAELVDVFWIGGTKSGALLGEAVVIPHEALAEDFEFHVKQRGALLAKGRVLGIQFVELFSAGLYFELAQLANAMARKLSNAILAAGHALAVPTESNQVFAILPNRKIEQLNERFDFYTWEKAGEHRSVVRLVTSWATDEHQVDAINRLF
ncbi:low specificity L-threonine aldolase [Pontiella sp.]|uniref:threonine aldolase family protein n=1 Tax=Pontiella sp. TaxID=2837462 RepID=UPI003564FC52